MNRTTEQRLGDITLVLTTVATLSFIASVWRAADYAADGSAETFWSFVGFNMAQVLFASFAAACLFNWMDDDRKRLASTALLVLHAVAALAIVGTGVFGRPGDFGGGEAASYVVLAAYFLMAAAAIAVVRGFFPPQLNGLIRESNEDETP